jgi:hypothetical protein
MISDQRFDDIRGSGMDLRRREGVRMWRRRKERRTCNSRALGVSETGILCVREDVTCAWCRRMQIAEVIFVTLRAIHQEWEPILSLGRAYIGGIHGVQLPHSLGEKLAHGESSRLWQGGLQIAWRRLCKEHGTLGAATSLRCESGSHHASEHVAPSTTLPAPRLT